MPLLTLLDSKELFSWEGMGTETPVKENIFAICLREILTNPVSRYLT